MWAVWVRTRRYTGPRAADVRMRAQAAREAPGPLFRPGPPALPEKRPAALLVEQAADACPAGGGTVVMTRRWREQRVSLRVETWREQRVSLRVETWRELRVSLRVETWRELRVSLRVETWRELRVDRSSAYGGSGVWP